MYASTFVLGFHGCDAEVGECILAGKDHVSVSENSHDWLGSGAYFWENSIKRAETWAELIKRNPQHFRHRIRKPFVIGAIIEVGKCLDLTKSESLSLLKDAYASLKGICEDNGDPLPVNESGFPGDLDLVKRHLDCAVINMAHLAHEANGYPAYDTVRGAFPEGKPLYRGARIMEQTHVQICVRHPRTSIRGYFRPLPAMI